IMKPARWLAAADAYASHGDLEGLEYAVERAGKLLDGNVQIEMIYLRMRSRLAAHRGKPDDAARDLARVKELLATVPKRSQKFETHQAEGECAMIGGRASDAIGCFESALEIALHPIEKHISTFWLAEALEKAGHLVEAAARYREVLDLSLRSRFTPRAPEAMNR